MKASTIQAEARDCISFASKRRRRATFIEHCLGRETSLKNGPHARNRACAYFRYRPIKLVHCTRGRPFLDFTRFER